MVKYVYRKNKQQINTCEIHIRTHTYVYTHIRTHTFVHTHTHTKSTRVIISYSLMNELHR